MNVRGGENGGSTLFHTNVVRSFIQKDAQPTMNCEIKIPNGLADDNWKLILYAQQKTDLKITGAVVYKGN